MGTPLVFEQAGLGVDVTELNWIGATRISAILWIAAVIVLRPKTVQDEGASMRALGGFRVRVAVFRRPGEVQ